MEFKNSHFTKKLNLHYIKQFLLILPLTALPFPIGLLTTDTPQNLNLLAVFACAVIFLLSMLFFIDHKLSFKLKVFSLLVTSLFFSIVFMFAQMPMTGFAFWLFALTLNSLVYGIKASVMLILTVFPILSILLLAPPSNPFYQSSAFKALTLLQAMASVFPFIWVIKYFRQYLNENESSKEALLQEQKNAMTAQIELLKSVMDTGPIRMFWKDQHGFYLGCNKQFAKDNGLASSLHIKGLKAADLFGQERGKLLEADDKRAIERNGESPSFENQIFNDQGEERWLFTSKSRFNDNQGNLLGTCSCYLDITSLKMVEAQLIHSRAIAESSNQAKSHFLINISHEFRTFSNSITGLSQTALKQSLTSDLQEYLTNINQSSTRLLSLTNDILDYSKIGSGKIHIARTPFSVEKLVDELERHFRTPASNKSLSLKIIVEEDFPKYLLGDFQRLYQITANLIDNAIKFTQSGGVDMRISQAQDQQDALLQLDIIDTGEGVSDAIREIIFEPFSSSEQIDEHSGHGLGLAITKSLVSNMHGEIWVKPPTEDETGSHFVVQLPLNEAIDFEKNHAGTADNFAYDFSGRQILLIENNRADAISISGALKQRNAYVNFYENFDDGVQQCLHRKFDCLLISDDFANADLFKLPELLNSYDTFNACPIFILTKNNNDDFRTKSLTAQFDGVLCKPISFQILFNDIQQAISNNHR
jgi:PAS domain S-box-containing protein